MRRFKHVVRTGEDRIVKRVSLADAEGNSGRREDTEGVER